MCMHRDRRSDEVRAAKAGPPLCGRPGRRLRASIALDGLPARPAALSYSAASSADHGHLRLWV